MSDAVPVVWLEHGEAREDAVRALDEWARTRGIRLVSAGGPGADEPPRSTDTSAADRTEKELERARSAIAADDADAAERALARAETLLREHPELPQAAWLRAEVERAWSVRWLRLAPRDEARARAAWQAAEALDGGRVAGVGETAFSPPPKAKVRVIVGGPGSDLILRVDGRAVDPSAAQTYDVELAGGEHQVVASVGGHVAFASWVAIAGAEPPPVRIDVADGGACGRDRFARVRAANGSVDAGGVGCERWIAAMPGTRTDTVLVARCERDGCGPLLEWRMEMLPERTAAPERRAPPWPAWATWTLVGAAAASAVAIGLVATGVFEARPVEQRFVVGGARQE